MLDCTMLEGIIYDALWYNICHAKVFRTPMFIPRSVNVCAIENYGLYHSPSSQEAHFGIKTMRFTTQKCHTFTP